MVGRRRNLGVETAEQADVVAVHEDVQVARQRVAGQHALAERGVQRDERGEGVAHRLGVDRHRAATRSIGPEHGRDANDCHDPMIL